MYFCPHTKTRRSCRAAGLVLFAIIIAQPTHGSAAGFDPEVAFGSVLAFAGSMAVIGALGLAGFALTSRKSTVVESTAVESVVHEVEEEEVALSGDEAWPSAQPSLQSAPVTVSEDQFARRIASVTEAPSAFAAPKNSAVETPANPGINTPEDEASLNGRWSVAVARDFTRSGVEFGWFIVVDESTHEVIELAALKVLDSRAALKELKRLIAKRGAIDSISVQEHDFVSAEALLAYCQAMGIEGAVLSRDAGVESGRYIDRFLMRFRLEFVGKEVYRSLSKAKDMAVEYIDFCNHTRPEVSLGGMAPARYQGFSG